MSIDFDPTIDYYKALGVDPKASADDIKKAYRKLAKQFHPDSTGGDKTKEQRFKDIGNAYDVLGDPKRRAQYDEVRAMGGRRPAGFPGGGFPGGMSGNPGQVWDLGDLFSQMFAGGPQASGGGGRRSVRFERGDDDGGWVFEHRQGGPRAASAPTPAMESKLQAADGSWLIVRGADVFSDVRVPFHHAILGTVVEVATVDGSASVKIPPGTSSGRKLRLRGKGVIVDGGRLGDHYVTVHLDVPAELDERGKKLLHELTAHLAQAAGPGKRK
ncbi:MAG: J domain-containing protein [Kofleriaceae bacterium]|jgi:DnaJ-class molecular chaperone|nr:J domain-containing protein [Kofleriaceae bacterium]MBP9172693.1 J domain-containing protein [Kofleriaceae bacterium]MBP9863559.1 J domain-containing protein [Kofleriaceae bacterium]